MNNKNNDIETIIFLVLTVPEMNWYAHLSVWITFLRGSVRVLILLKVKLNIKFLLLDYQLRDIGLNWLIIFKRKLNKCNMNL
jgi:hypothetical protein